MVSTNKNCQVECKKGANHIVRNKGKVHIFKPCDLDTAKSKIANAFPDDSVLPQPWVHPTLGVAYHSGETVLLAQPVSIPTSYTDYMSCSMVGSGNYHMLVETSNAGRQAGVR